MTHVAKTVFSLIQNVDNDDDDMSGLRGCFFKDGRRRIGMWLLRKYLKSVIYYISITSQSDWLPNSSLIFDLDYPGSARK